MTQPAAPAPEEKVVGNRKARVDKNHCAAFDGDKPWAVFMHTHYMDHWFYDGYSAHATKEEAEAARDQWLNADRPF